LKDCPPPPAPPPPQRTFGEGKGAHLQSYSSQSAIGRIAFLKDRLSPLHPRHPKELSDRGERKRGKMDFFLSARPIFKN